MKCEWNWQSLRHKVWPQRHGLIPISMVQYVQTYRRRFPRRWCKIEPQSLSRYFGRCQVRWSKTHWASSTFCSTVCRTLRIHDSDSHQSGWSDGKCQFFFDFVKEVRLDNFGGWGTCPISEQMCLEDPVYEFVLRAKEAIMKADEKRARCWSARFRLQWVPLRDSWHSTLNWCPGSWEWPPRTWLGSTDNTSPWASPISGLVDRSLCREFQILATCLECELSIQVGQIQVFVATWTSPCVSCLWALRHWQCYLPQVKLGVVNGEEVLAPSWRGLDGWENASTKSIQNHEKVCALSTSCFVAFRCSHFHPFPFACIALAHWSMGFSLLAPVWTKSTKCNLQFRLKSYAGGWEATCFDVSLDSQHCEPNKLSPVPTVFDRCSGRAPSASRRENFAPKRTCHETARRIQKVQNGQNGGQNGCEFWRYSISHVSFS